MAQQKSGLKLFAIAVLIIVLLFSQINIFINGDGLFFELEMIGFLLLVLLSFIGLCGYASFGERALFFVFVFYIMNLGLVWLINGPLYIILLLLALLGFLLTFPRAREYEAVLPQERQLAQANPEHSMVFESSHSPGKYVASKRGSVFHAPKCEWAKRIAKGSQRWFASDKEAFKDGLKKHSCVD